MNKHCRKCNARVAPRSPVQFCERHRARIATDLREGVSVETICRHEMHRDTPQSKAYRADVKKMKAQQNGTVVPFCPRKPLHNNSPSR